MTVSILRLIPLPARQGGGSATKGGDAPSARLLHANSARTDDDRGAHEESTTRQPGCGLATSTPASATHTGSPTFADTLLKRTLRNRGSSSHSNLTDWRRVRLLRWGIGAETLRRHSAHAPISLRLRVKPFISAAV